MRRALSLLSLAAALAGCDALAFDPSDRPFTEVDATAEPFTVDLAAVDTVGLWGTTSLAFRVGEGGPIRRVEVFLDGALVAAQDGPGPVEVSTAGRADGSYPFVLRAYGSPGTGSLADKLGKEEVLTEVTRVAVVDNRPPTPVDVVSAAPEGGFLRVAWEPYRRHNLRAYVVRESDYGRWTPVGRVADRRQTTWADSSFIGGKRTYDVLLEGGGQAVAGEPLTVSYPAPTLVASTHEGGGRVRIAWRPTPFRGAFESYILGHPYDYRLVQTMEAADDTSAVVQIEDTFGRAEPFTLTTKGRSGYDYVRSEFNVYTDPASPFVGPVVGMAGELLLGVDAGSGQPALRDARTLALRATGALPDRAHVYALAASPSGRVGALARWGGRTYALELHGATLQTLHRVDVTDWLGTDGRPKGELESGVFFTDRGVLVFGVESWGYHGAGHPTLLAVDVAAGRRVGQIGGDRLQWPTAVSNDGRYLVTGHFFSALYERDESDPKGYRLVAELPDPAYGAAFVAPDRLAILSKRRPPSLEVAVEVLAVPTLERVTTFGTTDGGHYVARMAADPERGQVAVIALSTLRVYDVATGRETAAFASTWPNGFSVAGGAVWGNDRYRRLP